MNLILFNNRIYGLTKGQYSPTSEQGKITRSSPHGTIESPFMPGELALGAGSNFYARVPDVNVKLMTQIMIQAEKHEGFSLVEVFKLTKASATAILLVTFLSATLIIFTFLLVCFDI